MHHWHIRAPEFREHQKVFSEPHQTAFPTTQRRDLVHSGAQGASCSCQVPNKRRHSDVKKREKLVGTKVDIKQFRKKRKKNEVGFGRMVSPGAEDSKIRPAGNEADDGDAADGGEEDADDGGPILSSSAFFRKKQLA